MDEELLDKLLEIVGWELELCGDREVDHIMTSPTWYSALRQGVEAKLTSNGITIKKEDV